MLKINGKSYYYRTPVRGRFEDGRGMRLVGYYEQERRTHGLFVDPTYKGPPDAAMTAFKEFERAHYRSIRNIDIVGNNVTIS